MKEHNISHEEIAHLAREKASEFSQREDMAALAITGSVARGMVWAGSDVDLWGFTYSGEEAFYNGVESTSAGDFYWEIDIAPLARLQVTVDENSWLRPPRLVDEDEISLVEALWGCEIVKDETGALFRIQQAISARVGDWRWLRQRAALYLSYGRGCLEGLHYAPALEAIVRARAVATRYGIAAYWMRAGTLLTSGMRIPERLAHAPEIQRLYREIYGLRGREEFVAFLGAFRSLPETVQEEAKRDLELEALPAAERGSYDGALRYMRDILPGSFAPETVLPVLGLGDNLEVRKRRVLRQTEALLELCGR